MGLDGTTLEGEAGPPHVREAVLAQARHLRLSRLHAMDGSDLHALLAGDPARALPWVEAAARHGLAEAQLRLGQMLLDGLGTPPDPAQAFHWFSRAASKGLVEAMNMVGRCCENGWGAAVDEVAAAHWYRRAAQGGYDWGQYNHAHMLFDGRGGPRDRVQALAWYRRAADQGHARAMNLVARCYEEGWGAPRDRDLAATWYRRSAEGGYFRAQFNLATLLAARGEVEAALTWLNRAIAEAPADSRRAMAEVLLAQAQPRLREVGRRLLGSAGAPPSGAGEGVAP